MQSITDQLSQLLTDYLSFHMSMEEYKKRVREIVNNGVDNIIGKNEHFYYCLTKKSGKCNCSCRPYNRLRIRQRQRQEETV